MNPLWLLFVFISTSLAAFRLDLEANQVDLNSRDGTIGIVGGDEADIADYPYMGALLRKGQQFCGAALLSNDTVLTSAQCVDPTYDPNFNISELSLRFGSSQWRSGGQEVFIKQITIHENFTFLRYDVAVLKLTETVRVENAVPISVAPASREYHDGTLGVVSGWGYTSSDANSSSEILRKVELPYLAPVRCANVYGEYLSEQMMCAGYRGEEEAKNPCQNDYGSPFVINGEVTGLLSAGPACDLGLPMIYAYIPALSDWIKLHAGL